ncbi:MAG: ankyrin repeat domain-containing protein [Fidelibacterota bacterium]|nr:MAG: ankyrin repeat domain-containing protein [Candidatus Neomarinimicrobiota bacterium]
MRSRIALSTSHIKHILCALPGIESGRVVLDLGRFGAASLAVDQLHIGRAVVRLPLSFHPGGDPDARSISVPLNFTNWQVRDEVIWFTLERAGILRGALFQAAQGALHKLINGIVRGLLEAGTKVNAKNERGSTALMKAAYWGHTTLIEALLEDGADVNVRDDEGQTALSLAASRGHTAIIQLLKQAGARE